MVAYERIVPHDERVFDSREPGADGVFVGGVERAINVAGVAGTLPVGCVGVEVVIGASQIAGNGYIAAWQPGSDWPGTIVQSISHLLPGIAGSKKVQVAFDAINVMVAGDEHCAAHLTVDVTGYLLG